MALYLSGKRSKKFRSILFKGLWVSRGQSPPFTQETDIHPFSRLKSVPVLVVAVRRPKILSKKKKLPYRECFKGALSLAERPLFVKQSPGLFHKFTPAERTACKRFGSCEKVRESNQGANEGLCPFNPHAPFKKGSILNFYDFLL